MSCNWNVSSTRPWLVSECSASSATAEANAVRSRIISSMVSRPTIERSAPASTSRVNSSISFCWLRNRCPAARTADLDDRHALQAAADALLAHRALDLDVDAAAGQAEDLQPLDDRPHEHRG